jgi:Cu-Zn family superoxide dismutase
MKRLIIICAGLLTGGTGCAPTAAPRAGPAAITAPTARADVRNVLGESKATVTASQLGDTIRVRVEAMGMPRGTYAAHVHAIGLCNPPDFTSAGPHWNPTGAQHGKNNPAGMHKGDLPNLTVGPDGRGSMEYAIPASMLVGGPNALLDADGAAVVIHAQADDYRTDPAGNAGARMACGVFR